MDQEKREETETRRGGWRRKCDNEMLSKGEKEGKGEKGGKAVKET